MEWSRYLMWAEYAQNSLQKPATGLTPFKCVLGYKPPLFPWSGEPSNGIAVQVQDTLPANGFGLLPEIRLRLPCKKLSPRYVAPFQILRQIIPVSFRLDLPANYRISPTFHVSLLKPTGGPREGEVNEEAETQMPPPILVEGDEAYQVRELLDSRRRGGILQYLVDWEGYGPEERSWVRVRDILDPALTEEFHRSHPEKPAPRPQGRPRRRQPPRVRSRSQGGGLCYRRGPCTFSLKPPEGGLARLLAQLDSPPTYLGLIVCTCHQYTHSHHSP